MVTKDTVSIIITTYKRKRPLILAIESALAQTYPKTEIIIVDDNAEQPEYRAYVHENVQKYIQSSRVRLIFNERNLGGAVSRNIGIQHANGDYVAFLDDDDEFFPEKIEKQMQKIQETNADLVYCFSQGIDEKRNILWENRKKVDNRDLLLLAMTSCIANTSLILCKKASLEAVGLFEDIPCKQDVMLELKLAAADYTFACVEEILLNYGCYGGTKISNVNPKTLQGYTAVRDYARKFYHKLTAAQIRIVEVDTASKLAMICIRLKDKVQLRTELSILIRYAAVKEVCKVIYYMVLGLG